MTNNTAVVFGNKSRATHQKRMGAQHGVADVVGDVADFRKSACRPSVVKRIKAHPKARKIALSAKQREISSEAARAQISEIIRDVVKYKEIQAAA